MLNNLDLKNWIKRTGLFTIEAPANPLINQIKNKFRHEDRSFFYSWRKYLTNSLYCHASPGVIETIITNLGDGHGKNLLNLGGGTGQVSAIFEFLNYDVYNVDISLEKTDEKNLIWNLNQSPYPFNDKSFDVIVGQEIIEHLENPWEFFRQAKRLLRENGVFILSTPNILSLRSRLRYLLTGYFPWFTPDCFGYHINPLPYWQIKLIADQTGFEIENIKGNGDYFFHLKPTLNILLLQNEEIIIILKHNQKL